MGTVPSRVTGTPVPDREDMLRDGYIRLTDAINGLELYTVMRFTSMSQMSALLTGATAPVDGMVAYVADTKTLYLRVNSAWRRIYPTETRIHGGSTVPPADLGSPGDVYLQT